MSADSPATIGLLFGRGTLYSALLEANGSKALPASDVGDEGVGEYWFRSPSGQLDYFGAIDLVGVDVPNLDTGRAIVAAVETVLNSGEVPQAVPIQLVIAVPTHYPEFQRRHLVSILTAPSRSVRLIDYLEAGLNAVNHSLGISTSSTAIAINGESGFELGISFPSTDGRQVHSGEVVESLSGRALDHFLLSTVLDRMPKNAGVANTTDADLSGLLARIVRSKSVLSRVKSLSFPMPEAGVSDLAVTLGRSDLDEFFSLTAGRLEDAIGRLKRRISGSSEQIERTVIVGEIEGVAGVLAMLDRDLAPVEVAPPRMLADGAALAGPKITHGNEEPLPSLMPIESFLRSRGQPILLQVPSASPPAQAPAGDIVQAFFNGVSMMIADSRVQSAQEALRHVQKRAGQTLAALTQDLESPISEAPRSITRDSEANGHAVRSSGARRLLLDAEHMLQAHKPIEAVHFAHQAWNTAPDDHEVLMALLDVHRRGAELLSGPEHFNEAVAQLNCALRHRENDEATRKALALRYQEQALYHEREGRKDDAIEMMEHALSYDDNPAIIDTFRRICGETG